MFIYMSFRTHQRQRQRIREERRRGMCVYVCMLLASYISYLSCRYFIPRAGNLELEY